MMPLPNMGISLCGSITMHDIAMLLTASKKKNWWQVIAQGIIIYRNIERNMFSFCGLVKKKNVELLGHKGASIL